MLVAALFGAPGVPAQTPPAREFATLRGRVVTGDSLRQPVSGATIVVQQLGRSTRSDSSGAYFLGDLPLGEYAVRVQAVGFAAAAAVVLLAGREQHLRDFVLMLASGTTLSTIDITATRLSEFEERRRRGGGYFMTRADLEKVSDRRFGDVLRGVPGLRIQRHASEASAVSGRGSITMNGSNPECYVNIYVDDAAVSNNVAVDLGRSQKRNTQSTAPLGVFNLNSLATGELEAVEYYSGGASVPPKYNRTGAACGVLLIWTRSSR